jgi:hypothetical protein
MKLAVLFVILAAMPAFAQEKPFCIDASRDGQYNARPISLHEVLARNAFGPDKRAARLSTTCIHVDRSATVSLHSFTRCIAVGDDVSTSVLGGHRELCRVTGVAMAPEAMPTQNTVGTSAKACGRSARSRSPAR